MANNTIRIPSPDEYIIAFAAVEKFPAKPIAMLCAHRWAPGLVMTTGELAEIVQYEGFNGVNAQYGRIGRALAVRTGLNPSMPTMMLVKYHHNGREWVWTLHAQVAEALDWLTWRSYNKENTQVFARKKSVNP